MWVWVVHRYVIFAVCIDIWYLLYRYLILYVNYVYTCTYCIYSRWCSLCNSLEKCHDFRKNQLLRVLTSEQRHDISGVATFLGIFGSPPKKWSSTHPLKLTASSPPEKIGPLKNPPKKEALFVSVSSIHFQNPTTYWVMELSGPAPKKIAFWFGFHSLFISFFTP